MSEMVKCKINGEYEIILPKHRAERPEWYTEEGWEKKRLAHMKANIKKGDVVYYVGAEEGDMAALCAMWGAEMVLFEPNEKVWPNIKAIWEANNFISPLICFPGFASNKNFNENNIASAFSFPESANSEVIGDHGFKELKDPDEIPQIKIDKLSPSYEIPAIISLDVEGSEWEVLRGAEETLKRYHPKIYLSLHPEFLHEQYGEWGAELRKWIIDLGYKETLIDYPLHECHLYYEAN